MEIASSLTQQEQETKEPVIPLPRTLITGVDLIDGEHAYLTEKLDQAKRICDRKKETCPAHEDSLPPYDKTLDEILTELLAYMVEHFRHEEGLMVGLPKWMKEQHVIEHANIAERFSELIRNGGGSEDLIASPSALQGIINNWLEDHIKQWDIPVAICLGFKPG